MVEFVASNHCAASTCCENALPHPPVSVQTAKVTDTITAIPNEQPQKQQQDEQQH